MAFPKSFLLLSFLFVFALLIFSHASACELTETVQQIESTKEDTGDVHEDGYGYYGHHGGHGYGGYHGGHGHGGYHGEHYGHYPSEKKLAETNGYGGYDHCGYGRGRYGGYEYGGYGYGHGSYGHGSYRHYHPPKNEEKKS